MKVRVVSELPVQKLGQSELKGKVLTFLQDNVEFCMSEVMLEKNQKHQLLPLHEGHNHIYYCIKGNCIVTTTDENHSEFTLTNDTVLALSSSTKANISVNEASRLVVVSVPALPNTEPKPFFLSLKDIKGTDRHVYYGLGYSRRFLRQADDFNISLHNTMPDPNKIHLLEYKNHYEANFLVKGRIEYWRDSDAEKVLFDEKDSVTGGGVMVLLDQHDRHKALVTEKDSRIISVFYPPLKGDEKHNFSDKSSSSY